jgi:SAM-dependent methyltransferase
VSSVGRELGQQDEAFFDAAYIEFASAEQRGTPVKRQVALISRVALARRAQPRVLDHCCGHGRHLEMLARMPGVRATGVDNNADFIAEARQRTAGRANLLLADARTFDPPGEFDIILSLESSIACFEPPDAARILMRLAHRLAPAGTLLLHQFNVDYARRLPPKTWIGRGKGLVILELRRFDDDGEHLTIVHHRFAPAHDSLYRSSTHALRLRPYTETELRGLIQAAGLSITAHYGDFDGNPPSTTSPDIILTATPPADPVGCANSLVPSCGGLAVGPERPSRCGIKRQAK